MLWKKQNEGQRRTIRKNDKPKVNCNMATFKFFNFRSQRLTTKEHEVDSYTVSVRFLSYHGKQYNRPIGRIDECFAEIEA